MFASYAFAKNNETILLTLFETSFFELQKHGEWDFLPRNFDYSNAKASSQKGCLVTT